MRQCKSHLSERTLLQGDYVGEEPSTADVSIAEGQKELERQLAELRAENEKLQASVPAAPAAHAVQPFTRSSVGLPLSLLK